VCEGIAKSRAGRWLVRIVAATAREHVSAEGVFLDQEGEVATLPVVTRAKEAWDGSAAAAALRPGKAARSASSEVGARVSAPEPDARIRRARPAPLRPHVVRPEEHLARAMDAQSARARALWARRGLASHGRLDRTTHAMLLRQLYLAHFESERFRDALLVSEQSLTLRVLTDVLHQDAARAAAALGAIEVAARHLRLAARSAPPSRRAFHWWTLGSVHFVAGQHAEAIAALERAARWGTRDKPLYEAQLELAKVCAGTSASSRARIDPLLEALEAVPAGQGYGRFVLGMLAFYADRHDLARAWLTHFIDRTARGPTITSHALRGEITMARRFLAALS
jgi:tetratricopeptide (TPR) repeat protein